MTTTPDIPRRTYGLTMLVGSLVAVLGAWAGSRLMGGTPAQAGTVAVALAIGSVAGFAPALLRVSPEYWGVVVLLSGAARALLVLGVCYGLAVKNPELAGRAISLPAVGGAVLMLALETTLAIRVLSRIEQRKAELKAAGATGRAE